MMPKIPRIPNEDDDDDDDDDEDEDEDEDEDDEADIDSADEALLDMLGLASLDVADDPAADDDGHPDPQKLTSSEISILVESNQLSKEYASNSFCIFPAELSIRSEHMRKITDELVWGGDRMQADRTHETIQVYKNGAMEHRRTLTRLENFVDCHKEWKQLCRGYLCDIVSAALGQRMVLYKEKLNLKPAGGSGFAPHLDSPSLKVALGENGPQNFVTVMVAIDDMTEQNGCLRICKGPWNEENHVEVIEPEKDGNPDAGGRAGAIEDPTAENLSFANIVCKGGSIVAFNGWAPHRSASNKSPFSRRAVFLTYNPASEGDFREQYYRRMDEMRNEWRESVGLANRQQQLEDEKFESCALATVPK
eukprot:CAMPEP_0113645198 /NCGR_PEP_ID=MMETSP0017_2-20120614/23808_1 /TAXON_ID=2856 /ORGANISM="Cylindrotheca closterium" /LENGTH=363 /DNA_ID=CAMNT_0000556889 /DNA_START=7 /DNA_END=1098 /DNA_ORIENTATION=+ /assembly_acc=CAM_ASM_000147